MFHVKNGQLKALATRSSARASIVPDVPTMAEAGIPGYEHRLRYGLVGPAGMPREAIDVLSHIANEALKFGKMIEPLRAQGIEPVGRTPEEFARFVEHETGKMVWLAKLGGLTNRTLRSQARTHTRALAL
jgi:tripartite-type tricarboxylate transporter receptor subunit TctC